MAAWRSVVLELTSRAGGNHSVSSNPDEATVEAPLKRPALVTTSFLYELLMSF